MTDMSIRRLPDTIHIARGCHDPGGPTTTGHRACTMEWVAWLAGEPWGDGPTCTHPVIAAAVRTVNDRLTEGPRQQLAKLIPELVGTADDREDPLARQRLSARLAAWCAEQVLHLVPTLAWEVCEQAIAAARAWADDPCDQTCEVARAAATAAYDATAYSSSSSAAAYAAIYAASAAIEASGAAGVAASRAATAVTDAAIDPIDWLRGLLTEHARLTTQEGRR